MVFIGAVATLQFHKVEEKSQGSEAVKFIGELRSKQEQFKTARGKYTDQLQDLEPLSSLKYFKAGPVTLIETPSPGWTVALTRNDASRITSYGKYSIIFNSAASPLVDCSGESNPAACREDLLSELDNLCDNFLARIYLLQYACINPGL